MSARRAQQRTSKAAKKAVAGSATAAPAAPKTSTPRLPTNRQALSPSALFRRALGIVDQPLAAQIIKDVEARLARLKGPTRQITVRVFIAGCIANAAAGHEPQGIAITTFLRSLPDGVRRAHNIQGVYGTTRNHLVTYRQVETMLVALAAELAQTRQGHNHATVDPDSGELLAPTAPLPDDHEALLLEHGNADTWIVGGDPLETWRATPRDCDQRCPASRNLNWFFDRLLAAAWQTLQIPDCSSYAIDSTHLTSHYKRQSWGSSTDADLDSLEAQTANSDDPGHLAQYTFTTEDRRQQGIRLYQEWEQAQASAATQSDDEDESDDGTSPCRLDVRRRQYGPTVTGDFTLIGAGFPRLGPDGRLRHTKDPDVTDTWHSGLNGERSSIAPARDDHHLTASGHDPDGNPLPPFIRAFRLTSGGSHKGDAGRDLILSAQHDDLGLTITDVQADRGYTVSNPDRFAHPLRDAGISLWLDLHPNQRKHGDDINGVLVIDGSFFASSLPANMRSLPACPRSATEAVRDQHEAAFNYRAQTYGFSTNGGIKPDGSRRYQGPARKGRLRCPNYGPSMRLAATVPLSNCVLGQDCSCARTITVGKDVVAKIRQDEFWGTTAWRKNFNRRNLVESGNAYLKYHHRFRRASIRVFRDARTHLHLGLFKVGLLLEQARRWRLTYATPDPQIHLDDESLDDGRDPSTPSLSEADVPAQRSGPPPPE